MDRIPLTSRVLLKDPTHRKLWFFRKGQTQIRCSLWTSMTPWLGLGDKRYYTCWDLKEHNITITSTYIYMIGKLWPIITHDSQALYSINMRFSCQNVLYVGSVPVNEHLLVYNTYTNVDSRSIFLYEHDTIDSFLYKMCPTCPFRPHNEFVCI